MVFSLSGRSQNPPRITLVQPPAALPGGEVEIAGTGLGPDAASVPSASLGGERAQVLLSRATRLLIRVPEHPAAGGSEASTGLEVRRDGAASNRAELRVARLLAGDLNPVSSPAVDAAGNVFATISGPRGQQVPVSVVRISPEGDPQPFLSGILNATALAFDAQGYLYVTSRHEGTVYRVSPEGAASVYAEGMGVATGAAFDGEGDLYVGDRSGTIFKIARDRQIFVFATLEPSVAAYHLAFGPDGSLYVTGPTTSSHEAVWAIDRSGTTRVFYRGLGRPQGLALDAAGNVYVAASLAGRRGIVRLTPAGRAELALAGSGLVGLAFAAAGRAVLATGSSVYDIALGVEAFRLF